MCHTAVLSSPLQKSVVDGSTSTLGPKGVSVDSSKGVSEDGPKGVSENAWSKELSLCPLQRSVVGNLWDDHDALLSPAGSYKTHGGGPLGGGSHEGGSLEGGSHGGGSLEGRSLLDGRRLSSSRALRANGDGDGSDDSSGDDSDDASLAYTPLSTSSSSINRCTHHKYSDDPGIYALTPSHTL